MRKEDVAETHGKIQEERERKMQGIPGLQSKWIILVLVAIRGDPFGSVRSSAGGLLPPSFLPRVFPQPLWPWLEQPCSIQCGELSFHLNHPKLPSRMKQSARLLVGEAMQQKRGTPRASCPHAHWDSILSLFLLFQIDLQCFMRKASHKILKFFSIQKCLQSKGLSEHKPSPDFFLVSFYITGNVDKMSPYSFKLFLLPIFLLQHTEMRDFMGRDSL